MERAISVRTIKTLSKQQTCDALKWLGIVVGWVMVCFLLTCILYVATPYSADQTAASCSASDIQAAIDDSISAGGGTVTIPACSGGSNGSTWAYDDYVFKEVGSTELRIIGQGKGTTHITYSSQQSPEPMFRIVGSGLKEFASMTLQGDGAAVSDGESALGFAGSVNTLIHDITFSDFGGPVGYFCGMDSVVAYNLTVGSVERDTYGFYVYGACNYYPDDWTGEFGGSDYDVFFEDNWFGAFHHPVSLFTGATVVIRYNTFAPDTAGYQDNIDVHGAGWYDCPGAVETTGSYNYDCDPDHGGRALEVYQNTFTCNGGACSYAVRVRAGSAIITQNTVTGYSDTHPYEVVAEDDAGGVKGIGSLCTSGNSWPRDIDFTGDSPDPCGTGDGCCSKIDNVFIWGNSGQTTVSVDNYSTMLAEDTDYHLEAPTLADDGFTWSAYTYPHPLREGESTTPTISGINFGGVKINP